MIDNSLKEDLLGIAGVEGAEVEGSPDAPAGLRIRIAEGADQQAVGGAIRRVLSSHGLGTDSRLPGETGASSRDAGGAVLLTSREEGAEADEVEPQGTTPQEMVSRDEGRAIIDLTDKHAEKPRGVTPESAGPSDRADPAEEFRVSETQVSESQGPLFQTDLPPFVKPRTRPGAPPSDDAPRSIARIDSVSVEEGRSGIFVTVVASDGRKVSQVAPSTEGGVESAVVKAAAKLVDDTAPDPIVVEIEDRRIEGVDIVMIILDVDGELAAGSAIVGAGRVFALGRATWAALSL